nr:helix-turn-helix domain-containing protein [Actinomadura roseirufa]
MRVQVQRRAAGHVTLYEREEISRGLAAGMSGRAIARRLNRPGSTVAGEISRDGGRERYRALDAQARAARLARRPKPAKLTVHSPLRRIVEERLECRRSPQQIARWSTPTISACGSYTRRSTCRCPTRGGH